MKCFIVSTFALSHIVWAAYSHTPHLILFCQYRLNCLWCPFLCTKKQFLVVNWSLLPAGTVSCLWLVPTGIVTFCMFSSGYREKKEWRPCTVALHQPSLESFLILVSASSLMRHARNYTQVRQRLVRLWAMGMARSSEPWWWSWSRIWLHSHEYIVIMVMVWIYSLAGHWCWRLLWTRCCCLSWLIMVCGSESRGCSCRRECGLLGQEMWRWVSMGKRARVNKQETDVGIVAIQMFQGLVKDKGASDIHIPCIL